MVCDTCDFAAPSIRCGRHYLNSGIVRELHQAMMDGKMWGDVEYDWAQEKIDNETAIERAQRELNAKMEEMKYAAELRQRREEKYVNKGTGGLMKLNRPMPCKYVNEPETVDKFGVKWEAGCQHHKKGICPYLHPGQMGYEEALAAKSQRRRW
jgi:hypothetical protein